MENKRENGKEMVKEWGNEKMEREWGNEERGRNGERDLLPLHVFSFSPLHFKKAPQLVTACINPVAVVAHLCSVYNTISLFLIATKSSFQFGLVLHVVVKHPKASLDQRQSFVNGSRARGDVYLSRVQTELYNARQ